MSLLVVSLTACATSFEPHDERVSVSTESPSAPSQTKSVGSSAAVTMPGFQNAAGVLKEYDATVRSFPEKLPAGIKI
jgi:hypothetical protein